MSSKYQMPGAWSAPASPSTKIVATSDEPKKTLITANPGEKIDMSEDVAGAGLCPVCREPMQRGFMAGQIPVMVCLQDRVTLPISDKELEETQAATIPNSETGFVGLSFINN